MTGTNIPKYLSETKARTVFVADGAKMVSVARFDCHTLKGKRAGKTKADFFREEQRALKPFQPGLFDDLPES